MVTWDIDDPKSICIIIIKISSLLHDFETMTVPCQNYKGTQTGFPLLL